jgi:hypothetical protein
MFFIETNFCKYSTKLTELFNEFCDVPDLKFAHDVLSVRFNGEFAQEKQFGNFFVLFA